MKTRPAGFNGSLSLVRLVRRLVLEGFWPLFSGLSSFFSRNVCEWLDRNALTGSRLHSVKWPPPRFSLLKVFQLKQQVYVHHVLLPFFCRSGENECLLFLKWLCFEDNASCECDVALFRSLSVLIWIVSGQCLSAGELVSALPRPSYLCIWHSCFCSWWEEIAQW